MTIVASPAEPEFAAFKLRFVDIHNALRRIDRARLKLIEAQNNLVHTLRALDNPYAEDRFARFYAAGGVTADDWKASLRWEANAAASISRGQLRVVRRGPY